MSDNPPKRGLSVTVVIVIASSVLVAMAGIIIVLAMALTSAQNRPQPAQDDDDDPQVSEIVLDASWGDGSALVDEELDVAAEIITTRLEEIEVAASDIYLDDEQIHVTFDDDVDEDTLDAAADALDVAFSADFRPVLETGLCTNGLDLTDYGPDEEVVVCDAQDTVAFALGASEVTGQTIQGASATKPEIGEYWAVAIVFNATGAADLADMTQRLFGAADGQNRLVILLDGEVLASPAVTAIILDGKVTLSGSWSEADAEALASELRFASRGLTLDVDSTNWVK
jgi:hypothetical protein